MSDADARRDRTYRIALGGLLVVAASLRIAFLGRSSFWIDEVFESYLVHAPSEAFWSALRFDAAHPPLDYLIGRMVEAVVHPSDPWLRAASVVWGVASIAALAALVRRRGGARMALLTAAILAPAPFHVRYSQELRPYALGTFLACLSLLLLDRALERPSLGRRAALFGACLATAYSLYLAAVAVAVGAAAMIGTDAFSKDPSRRSSARGTGRLALPAAAGLALLYLPWWEVVRRAAGRVALQPEELADPKRLRLLLAFFTVSPKQEGWAFGPRPVYAAAFGLALALLAVGTAAAMKRPALRFLPVWAFGGIAAVEVLRAISPRFGAFRYALPSGIALAAVSAAGLDDLLAGRLGRAAPTAALAILLAFDGFAVAFYYRAGRYDWNPELAFLRALPPSQTIFTSAHNPQYCLAYYLCGPTWLTDGHRCGRPLVNLEGDIAPLDRERKSGRSFSLVLDGMPASAAPREWAREYPGVSFPEAEGTVVKVVPSGRRP